MAECHRCPMVRDMVKKRVLNDLKRTRLSCRHMIWILSLIFLQKVVSLSQSFCVSLVELIEGRGEGGGWKSQIFGKKTWSPINHSLLLGVEEALKGDGCSVLSPNRLGRFTSITEREVGGGGRGCDILYTVEDQNNAHQQ